MKGPRVQDNQHVFQSMTSTNNLSIPIRSLSELISDLTLRIGLGLGITFTILFSLLSVFFYTKMEFNRLDSLVRGSTQSLSQSISLGDYFQISKQLDSFTQSGTVYGVWLFESKNGELIKKVTHDGNKNLTLSEKSVPLFVVEGLKLLVPRTFTINSPGGVKSATLVGVIAIPLLDYLLLFLGMIALLVTITFVIMHRFQKLAFVISLPIVTFCEKIVNQPTLDDLSKEPRSFPFKEISLLYSSYSELTKKLIENQRMEKEAEIGRITAHLSHDLRAPLGTFERLISAPDEALPEMRGAVKDSLNRINSMIESLRHAEVENLVHRSKSKIDFRYGAEAMLSKAKEHSVEFFVPKIDVDDVWIDSAKVERGWINLASNAIEAAKSYVKVEVEREGASLFIRVIDDGEGVPSEALPKLFKRGMTHGKAGGTGLGLAYVKQIMQGHGGDVNYRRENGLTIFECRLPQAYGKHEVEEVNGQAVDKEPIRLAEEKKVAIKLIPESLALGVCEALSSYKSEIFSFSCESASDTQIMVLNDDELLFQVMDEGKEPLQLSRNLDQKQIVDRLARKFNLV